MSLAVVSIVAGLVILTLGGDLLVRGATRLATLAGVSSLVIGLTVVAYGTSAPELIVSSYAALEGKADIAVGNVAGSNAFNMLFIPGICAVLAPLVTSPQLVRRDVPLMVAATGGFLAVAWDRIVHPIEGLLLLSGAVGYSVYSIVASRREQSAASLRPNAPPAPPPARARDWVLSGVLVVAGLGALVWGGRLLVDGATSVARMLGVSEAIIALTIVSAGTSLPEVAASVIATLRGERDIAIGNVVGSTIFNILMILGASSAISGSGLAVSSTMQSFDIPLNVVMALAIWSMLATQLRLDRWEGAVLFASYVAYVTYLVLVEIHASALGPFRLVMAYGVLPVLGLLVVGHLAYSLLKRRPAAGGAAQR
ncbi:MAG: calcium/sodium antiporter [Polyangiaceae bacterium]|nr:calcium/sodium antiporter [Polyangiaceae bacterium]